LYAQSIPSRTDLSRQSLLPQHQRQVDSLRLELVSTNVAAIVHVANTRNISGARLAALVGAVCGATAVGAVGNVIERRAIGLQTVRLRTPAVIGQGVEFSGLVSEVVGSRTADGTTGGIANQIVVL